MALVFYFPLIGTPTKVGYQLSFFEAGTDTPLDVWTDSDLTIPWSQPIILNATGNSDGPIYLTSTPTYKVVYEDENGVAIPGYPVDFITPSNNMLNALTPVTTVLTNAQIIALPTTPVVIVTAPAAGLYPKPLAMSLRVKNTSGVYTNVNSTFASLQAQWTTNDWATTPIVNDTGITALTQFLHVSHDMTVPMGVPFQQTTAVGWVFSNDSTQAGFLTSDLSGAALYLAMDNNGSGVLTGGNAANTLTVTTYYVLESVA